MEIQSKNTRMADVDAVIYIPIINKINKQKSVLKVNIQDKIKYNLNPDNLRIKNGYAYHSKLNNYVHRIITNNNYKIVDHMNKDRMDCTRKNLRESDYRLNKANSKAHGKRRYKGVRKSWSRYRSTIVFDGKQIHLGMFDSEIDAAIAYNKAAIKYFGNHSELNNV